MVANVSLLDVTPEGASIQVTTDAVVRSVARAIAWGGAPAPRNDSARFDSGGSSVMPSRHALDAYNRHVDELAFRAYYDQHGRLPGGEIVRAWNQYRDSLTAEQRRDTTGLSGGAGAHPRDLEFVRAQVWEEKRQPLNAMRLFPRDTAVPLGARKHTAQRLVGSGEAEVYRGGSVQSRATTSSKEESFGVAYIVSAVQTNFFDTLSTDYAGVRQFQNDLRVARRLVDERANDIFFNGSVPDNIPGVLNYPHLATQTFPVTISDATSPYDIVRQLNTLQYTPMIRTGGTFSPTMMVTSPRVRAFLYSRKHDVTGSSDTTIARYFLDNQDPSGGIQGIEAAQELQGIGPNGEDGILMYRPEVDSLALVDIQATTTLPVYQSSALEQITVVYAAIGGTIMGDVGNHILALAPVSGIG